MKVDKGIRLGAVALLFASVVVAGLANLGRFGGADRRTAAGIEARFSLVDHIGRRVTQDDRGIA